LPSAIFGGRFNLFFRRSQWSGGEVEEGKYECPLITDRGHRTNHMIAARLQSMIDYQQTAERNGGTGRVVAT
jgi:hypothetical protein